MSKEIVKSVEEFNDIFEQDIDDSWEGDNALEGLILIQSYFNKEKIVLCGANHDIIYSVGVDDLVEKEITKEDAIKLKKLNWMVQDDYLSCFV